MKTIELRDYEGMSPFEIKDEMIKLATASSKRSAQVFLNAGRPCWRRSVIVAAAALV